MKKNKNLLRAILLISIVCGIFAIGIYFENVNTISSETVSLEVKDYVTSIKLGLSSDDVLYLNGEAENSEWRKVKLFSSSESSKIYIKNGILKDEAYQIRIDDDVYHLYSVNIGTIESYVMLQGAKLKDIETTSPEFIKLYFNEVPMGYYIKEEVTHEQIRDSEENYFITLNSNTDYMKELNYYLDNGFDTALEYFALEELAKYMAFYEMFNDDKYFSLKDIFFKYNSSTKKLTPYITINTSPNNTSTDSIKSKEISNLIDILDNNYEFMETVNEKRTTNLGDTTIIKNLEDIYNECKNFATNLEDDGYYPLKLYYDSRLNDISIKVEEFKQREPYHRTIKERFELNEEWEYLKSSHIGGFYTESFDLTFEAPAGCKVYYTVDGREPTDADYLYTEPIKIESKIGEEYILANIKDTSTEWKKPKGESYKATVIRSIVYHDGKPVSNIMTNTYFVDENIKDRFRLPVISIVTEPDNFFGFNNGIYVLGKKRADWLARNPASVPGRGTSANYTQRGSEWERPIHMEWFESDGEQGFSQSLGVRINGGWSRSYPLKAFKVYARKEYDTKGHIDYEIFPDLKKTVDSDKTIMEYDTFLLRNSGHDFLKTMFKDAMIQSLMIGTKVDIQSYRPAVVFINGEYWGINNVRERQDEDYIESHYEIPKEDVVILENRYRVKSGNSNDKYHFIDMANYIKNNDIKDDKVYQYVKTQMDVENFIDYNILQIFIANGDFPFNNVKYWRKKTENSEESSLYGHDGKWRWLLFDTDSGFQFTYRMSLSYVTEGNEDWASVLLRNLLENNDFKNQFISRCGDLLNTNLKTENIIDRINAMESAIEPEISYHIDRWNTSRGSVEAWNGYVEDLREFARLRPYYVRKDFVNFFDLGGTVEGVVEVSKENQGETYINNTPINNTEIFNGIYFKDVPITLTAIPMEGYQFIGWEGSVTGSESTITFTPDEDFNIVAKFEKIDSTN